MIKLKNILHEVHLGRNPELTPEKKRADKLIATNRGIQKYIKDGSKDDLDLSNSPIEKLPDNLTHVGGDLNLYNTKITSLPDNLTVGGNLDLRNTNITSLPDNLKVSGNLYLSNTPITSLPGNLTVGGYLYLYNTLITSLPNNLTVGGDLYLSGTPLSKKYSKQELKRMYPGIKGLIFL